MLLFAPVCMLICWFTGNIVVADDKFASRPTAELLLRGHCMLAHSVATFPLYFVACTFHPWLALPDAGLS